MKKINIIFATLIALSACLLLSGCGEEHSHARGVLSSDEEYHWYACISCDTQLEKKAHSWDAGTVTSQPTTDNKGEKTYMCNVCGTLKKEEIEKIKKTDVSSTQWASAFGGSSFANVTATIEETVLSADNELKTVYQIKASSAEIYLTVTKYRNGEEFEYYGKYQVGYQLWEFSSKEQTIEDARYTTTVDVMSSQNILSDYRLDFSAFYDSFTYNEGNGTYTSDGLVSGGAQLENIRLSFENGRLVSVMATEQTEGAEQSVKITLSEYGTTKPTPPQNK